MDSNLALILMTATFMLGMVYGSFAKTFPGRKQSTFFGQETQMPVDATRPIDATFVALLSTYLPRYPRMPRQVSKRMPERIHWVGDEDPILPVSQQ